MQLRDYVEFVKQVKVDHLRVLARLLGGGMLEEPYTTEGGLRLLKLLHGAGGLCKEAGEVMGVVDKVVMWGRSFQPQVLKDELGDVLWYLVFLANSAGLTLEDIMSANATKLRQRWPEVYNGGLGADGVGQLPGVREDFHPSHSWKEVRCGTSVATRCTTCQTFKGQAQSYAPCPGPNVVQDGHGFGHYELTSEEQDPKTYE